MSLLGAVTPRSSTFSKNTTTSSSTTTATANTTTPSSSTTPTCFSRLKHSLSVDVDFSSADANADINIENVLFDVDTNKNSAEGRNLAIIIHRCVAFIVLFGFFVYNISSVYPVRVNGVFFTYLTYWNLMMQAAYYFTVSATALARQFKILSPSCSSSSSSWFRFLHIFLEHAYIWAFFVLLLYWTAVFPDFDLSSGVSWLNNLVIHGAISVFAHIEVFLTKVKFYWRHLLYTIAASLVYAIFNGIYSGVSGSPIYSILTWDTSSNIIIDSFMCLGFLLLVVVIFGLARFVTNVRDEKIWTQERQHKKQKQKQNDNNDNGNNNNSNSSSQQQNKQDKHHELDIVTLDVEAKTTA